MDYHNLDKDRYKKHHTDRLRRRILLGTGVVIVAGAYVWHRRVLDRAITLSLAAVEDTKGKVFDDGVKYGIVLAKHIILEGDSFAASDAVKYVGDKAYDMLPSRSPVS